MMTCMYHRITSKTTVYILLNPKDVMCKNIRLFKNKQVSPKNNIVVSDVSEERKTQ